MDLPVLNISQTHIIYDHLCLTSFTECDTNSPRDFHQCLHTARHKTHRDRQNQCVSYTQEVSKQITEININHFEGHGTVNRVPSLKIMKELGDREASLK